MVFHMLNSHLNAVNNCLYHNGRSKWQKEESICAEKAIAIDNLHYLIE